MFLNCPLSEEMLSNLHSNQAVWEQEVLEEETKSAPPTTKQPIKECLQNPILPFPAQTRYEGQRRRLSLPTIHPLHQMFDRMTQPDNDFPRGGQLRRNFSLTDRRRSSLHRGLHSRNSLKLVRARKIRPSSICLESTEKDHVNLRPRGLVKNHVGKNSKTDPFESDCEKENSVHSALHSHINKRRGS